MYKCRHMDKGINNRQSDAPVQKCVCPDSQIGVDGREKRLQRQFLKDHVNQREFHCTPQRNFQRGTFLMCKRFQFDLFNLLFKISSRAILSVMHFML